jgi:SAM-dependent methyltransferase
VVEAGEIRRRWREAAPRWRRNGAIVRDMTASVSEAMVEMALPDPGECWLDVASGLGDPATRLAERVGPRGRVVMSDLAYEMAVAASESLGGRAEVVTAAAEALPFRPVFDGVTCRFGAMFFADPPLALAELRRALRPGGRAVFAVWGDPERNPFFHAVSAAVREVVPEAPEPDPDDPHGFRYAPAGKLGGLLRSGGWVDVEERTLAFVMRGRIDLDEFWTFLLSMSADMERMVEELPDARGERLREGVRSRVAGYFEDGDCRFPAEARLVFAREGSR